MANPILGTPYGRPERITAAKKGWSSRGVLVCRDCSVALDERNWSKVARLGKSKICRDCDLQRRNRWRKLRRRQIIELLGDACELCGVKIGNKVRKLNLAHRYYAPDSAKSREEHKRINEAKEHPERFYILCPSCHRAYDKIKQLKGIDVVALPPLRESSLTRYIS